MNVKITQETGVNRPTPSPLTSTVLDHATIVDNTTSFGLRNNEGLWPSYNCMETLVPTELCADPMVEKTFAFAEWVPGFQFAVYGGVQCKTVGLDVADQKAEIKRVFERNEGKGVEQALLLNRFVALAPGSNATVDPTNPGGWGAPTNVTPSTAVPLNVALALLEGHAATVYAGIPTIHMPRAAASMLGDRIVWEGGKAFTRTGSKVAIGGGYDEQDLSDGKWDLYATGEVFVERSKRINVQTYVLPGDDAPQGDNSVLALVERMFRVGVDCFVAKATGTVW